MKNFTKIMLGLAGTLAGIGLICFLAAFCMGFTLDRFVEMVHEGKFTVSFDGQKMNWFDEDDFVGGENTEIIEQDCRNLEINYDAGELEIYYGDVLDVQVENKNVRGFSITIGGDEGNETLYIEGDLEIGINDGLDAKLVIILPYDMKFEDVTMKLGASQAKIDGLQADQISVIIGAGQADISNVNTNKLELEVGAGEANITGLTVDDLDVETGVGEVNLELNAAECDYNYSVKCGIGNVVVGENSYGGMGASQNVTNSGAAWIMNVECGIGEVQVHFICDNTDRDTCTDSAHHHSTTHSNVHGESHH